MSTHLTLKIEEDAPSYRGGGYGPSSSVSQSPLHLIAELADAKLTRAATAKILRSIADDLDAPAGYSSEVAQ